MSDDWGLQVMDVPRLDAECAASWSIRTAPADSLSSTPFTTGRDDSSRAS